MSFYQPQTADRVLNGFSLGHNGEIWSANRRYRLVMQEDGNLVGYEGDRAFWSTQTNGRGRAPYRSEMQRDGNFVVYDGHSQPLWASNTNGQGAGCHVIMQDDRNIVMYNGQTAVWSSKTNVSTTAPPQPGGPGYAPNYAAPPTSGFAPTYAQPGYAAPPATPPTFDKLVNGYDLQQGQQLTSRNGRYRLMMQSDGNLVGYAGTTPFWSSKTNNRGRGPYRLSMQRDGNLVVYDAANSPLWASGTNGRGANCHLFMQDDRNIVVYNGATTASNAVWASSTNV